MKGFSTFIILLFLSSSIHACMVPRAGEEFDALIIIDAPNDKDQYRVAVPRKLEGYKYSASVELSYGKELNDSGYWAEEFSEPIKMKRIGKQLVGYFSIKKLKDYKVSVSVYWSPNEGGLCGTYAGSKVLYEG